MSRRACTDRASGQATVELALCLPVVCVAVLLVLQAGIVGRDRLRTQQAAREAARAAAVDPSLVVARAAALAGGRLDPTRATVSISGGRSPGTDVTVHVRYRERTDLPLVGPILPDLVLDAAATMQVEG